MDWIRQILSQPAQPTPERTTLSLALGDHLSMMGDIAGSAHAFEAALEMARTLGDQRLVARSLMNVAFFSVVDERADLAAEAQAIADGLGDDDLAASAMHMQGLLAPRAGRYDDAVAHYRRALATGRDPSQTLGTRYMLAVVLSYQGRWDEAREQLLGDERERADAAAYGQASLTCTILAHVELCRGDVDGAQRAFERAEVWGRPADDYLGDQMVFDATGALLRAVAGDVEAAAERVRALVDVPFDATGHGIVCLAWLEAGEVLARAGCPTPARRCFVNILRHRSGRFPRDRALGLAGVAGTCADRPDLAAAIAATAGRLVEQYGLAVPPWYTAARYEQGTASPPLTPDEAVAIAVGLDAG